MTTSTGDAVPHWEARACRHDVASLPPCAAVHILNDLLSQYQAVETCIQAKAWEQHGMYACRGL